MRVALSFLLCAVLHAQDWNQWRGPRRDGSVAAFKAPASWPAQLTRQWRVSAGGGTSSPVVSRDRIFLHSREEENEVVSAFDRVTGKLAWRQSYPAPFSKNQYAVKMGKGPNSTPILEQGKLYTLGVTAILSCWNASGGELVWRKDFSKQLDTSKLFTGTAMSPIVDSGAVIVHIGDDRGGEVLALKLDSGAEKWAWRADGPGYASPILVELDGKRQIVTLTDRRAIALDPANGELLWSIPFKDEWIENIVTPVQHGSRIIFGGVRKGMLAVDVTRVNGEWAARAVWTNPDINPYMSTPVLDGDRLYGMSQKRKGQFFCVDASTGKTLWATEGREGQNASVVSAGDFLILLTEGGELSVARKSPERFDRVARYQLTDSESWAHPIVIGENILIRDVNSLTLWRL